MKENEIPGTDAKNQQKLIFDCFHRSGYVGFIWRYVDGFSKQHFRVFEEAASASQIEKTTNQYSSTTNYETLCGIKTRGSGSRTCSDAQE